MKKHLQIVLIIAFAVLSVIIVIYLYNNNKKNNEIIYDNTIYFSLGSIKVRIYDNGIVEEDREIESPNHKSDFKEIKKLTKEEVNELKSKLEELDEEQLDRFVNKLIYGEETPGTKGF